MWNLATQPAGSRRDQLCRCLEVSMRTRKQEPSISIIIPCWNEERNLENGVLDEVRDYLAGQDYAWEVIVINDESTDNSRSLVERFVARNDDFSLYDIAHGAKPGAVWAGIQRARGEVVLFADMDQSTPIEELGKLLPWYDQGYDVVIGSRGISREGFSLSRRAGSLAFRNARRLFLLREISDTQCGFKSCRRQAALELFPRLEFLRRKERPEGWRVTAYDVELLYLAQRAGYRIKEVPVRWSNRDRSDTKGQGRELARYLHESAEMAREVVRIKTNELRGAYDGA
jgi:dolichyl-phosphate beta-glucosyltransferase